MAIRRVTGAVSPSELIFADANALGATYDGTGTTIERGETFTLPAAGTTAVSNGALRLEALKGDCTITNNGNSTLTNASGVDGTIVMRSGASDFPAFVRNSSMGSMSTPRRDSFDLIGSIIQVKHYTFTSAKSFTGLNSGVYRWITDSIKGGSSDYITFDNPIKSGNHVLLYFNAPITTEGTDLEYLKLFIREGSATTDGINAGVNVSGQSANGMTGATMYYSSGSQHGTNFGTMSFAHKFAPTAVTGSTVTNPNLSIVLSAKAYSSTNITIHIGGHHYNTLAMVEEGYQVTLQEIQV